VAAAKAVRDDEKDGANDKEKGVGGVAETVAVLHVLPLLLPLLLFGAWRRRSRRGPDNIRP